MVQCSSLRRLRYLLSCRSLMWNSVKSTWQRVMTYERDKIQLTTRPFSVFCKCCDLKGILVKSWRVFCSDVRTQPSSSQLDIHQLSRRRLVWNIDCLCLYTSNQTQCTSLKWNHDHLDHGYERWNSICDSWLWVALFLFKWIDLEIPWVFTFFTVIKSLIELAKGHLKMLRECYGCYHFNTKKKNQINE
jgi:hypothetical protein